MSQTMKDAIAELKNKLQLLLDDVAETKKAINTLARSIGEEMPYPDVSPESAGGTMGIRPDQYYGKPLAGSVREYIAMRGHAATVSEILDALKRGGFDFGNDKFAERNLRISLAKNTAYFVQVRGSDSFGLPEFYPDLKREEDGEEKKKTRRAVKAEEAGSDSEPKTEQEKNPKQS